MLSIIVATDSNGGIGLNNKLLWHISDDLKRFKELTMNHKVVMGRKTFESLPNGALPNRHNIVITSSNRVNTISPTESLIFKNNAEELIEEYKDSPEEVFVIGGGFVYQQFLPFCNKIYLTRVCGEYEADTFFKYDEKDFKLDYCSEMLSSDVYDYKFINLVRKFG